MTDESQPRPVHVTRAADVHTAHGQTQGMIRQVGTLGLASTLDPRAHARKYGDPS